MKTIIKFLEKRNIDYTFTNYIITFTIDNLTYTINQVRDYGGSYRLVVTDDNYFIKSTSYRFTAPETLKRLKDLLDN